MSQELIPYGDVEKMAIVIAKSTLFGLKTPEQALALMLIAQAEGKHPATAALEYNIIQNKPALTADAMLTRFQANQGSVKWEEYTDEKVSAIFTHPQGGSLKVTWTIDQAKKITFDTWENNKKITKPLTQKDNWKNYPRAMLRARVISEGIRAVFPIVCQGRYTPEEVGDFSEKQPLKAELLEKGKELPPQTGIADNPHDDLAMGAPVQPQMKEPPHKPPKNPIASLETFEPPPPPPQKSILPKDKEITPDNNKMALAAQIQQIREIVRKLLDSTTGEPFCDTDVECDDFACFGFKISTLDNLLYERAKAFIDKYRGGKNLPTLLNKYIEYENDKIKKATA